MTRRIDKLQILMSIAITVLTFTHSSAEVELRLEWEGKSWYGFDFYETPNQTFEFPMTLDVRLVGDEPLTGLTWNWEVNPVFLPDGVERLYFVDPIDLPNPPPFFVNPSYLGPQQGELIAESSSILLERPTNLLPPLETPYDLTIASYTISFLDPDLPLLQSQAGEFTLSLTDGSLPLEWWNADTGAWGVPDVSTFRIVDIGPEPTSALLLIFGVCFVMSLRTRRRSSIVVP